MKIKFPYVFFSSVTKDLVCGWVDLRVENVDISHMTGMHLFPK